MDLFLKILGVAGIVLGSIVAILLLVILSVLFVPVFYRISGNNEDGQHHIHGKISWLFPVLTGKGGYEDGQPFYQLRLFGFYLFRYPGKNAGNPGSAAKLDSERKVNAGKKEKSEQEKGIIRDSDFEKEWEAGLDKEQNARDSKMSGTDNKTENSRKTITGSKPGESSKSAEDSKPGKSSKSAGDRKSGKKDATEGEDKRDVWEKISSFRAFLDEEENKTAFRRIKDTLVRLLKALRPRKITGCIVFGTDDPALTAQIIGIIAIIYGMIGYGIEVHPDFQEKKLEYQFEIAGHVSVFSLVGPLLSLWRSGQLKILQSNLQKLK